MVVTHLFQVLGSSRWSHPPSLDAEALRPEKRKVYDALRPSTSAHVVRGQYEGYRNEPGVPPDSQTETMVALRAEIDNWRWAGVPFFLRSGKNMGAGRQVSDPRLPRAAAEDVPHRPEGRPAGSRNELVIDFDDPGWIAAPVPGQGAGRRR